MGRTAKQITAREIKALRHSAKDGKRATRYGLGETRFYLWVYPTNKKEFYYKSISGQWHKLGELTELYTRERAKQDYSKLYAQDALNLLEKTPKQRATAPTLKQCYDEFFTQAYALRGEVGTREYENDLRKRKDAKKRLPKWILQPLGDKLLSELNAQILINNFTKNPDELPTRETTKKCLIVFKTLLKQAKIRGLIDDLAFIDQARSELKEILPTAPKNRKERATLLDDKNRLDEQKTSELIKCVMGGKMSLNAKLLFAFMMINPQRQNELRHLRASDLTRDKTAIKYHAHNNKTSAQALIPLSPQGRRIIELALKISGGKYIFSINSTPISDNTLNKFIKENGLNFTMHSIRATFATSIQASDELGENSIYRKKLADVIMLHITQSAVDKAYFLEQAKQSELLRVLEFWANKMENLGLDIDYLEQQVKDLLKE
nr:MAG TPA: Integrase [Caudoviricetes sp.]